jgi:glycosyltransferase involved in cell wall biosynthesis
MRYVWEPEISLQYAATLPALLRPLWPALCAYLRRADFRASRRVDQFIANSQTVAERIRRHYGRDSTVVHPPVELPEAPTNGTRDDFYLCVGHHVRYKRLSLAIEACVRLHAPLVVIGDGPDVEKWREASPAGIRFLGFQPDSVVIEHYRRAKALLFPGEEDFGIVPVEAMAHGCPVIAYGRGGARETVVEGATGMLFEQPATENLVQAMQRADVMSFNPVAMFEHAQRFSRDRFLCEMRDVLSNLG